MSPSSKQPSPTPPGELLEHVADSAAFTPLLDALGAARAGSPLRFEHVAPAAQAFVAALAIRQLREAGDLPGRVWILCGDLKAQERVAGEIDFWLGGGALFFPESETLQFEEAIPDPEITAERMSILHRLATRPRERAADAETPPEVLVLNAASLAEEVPSPASMQQRERRLVRGERLAPEEFKDALESAGYLRVAVVDSRGQFARRGGILDIYSWQAPHPVRIELFDEEIESLREFDIHSQISIGKIQETAILLEADKQFVPLADYITGEHRGESDLVLALDCQDERSRVLVTSAASGAEGEQEDFESACFESPLGGFEAGDLVVQGAKREAFQAQLAEWKTQSWMVAMAFNGQGEIDRFSELIDSPRPGGGFLRILSGRLNQGFAIPGARLAVISDAEVFGRYHHNRARRLFQRDRQQRLAGARSDFKDFTPGDLVVHSEYGIGRFLGIGSQDPEDPDPSRDGECVPTENVLLIEYAQQARLYVPLAQAHLVSRYVGVGRKAPSLSRLGGNRWTLTRVKAQRAVEDYAAQLLSIHAERDAQRGFEHPPDTRWQWEFEHSFPYKETPDQLSAIEETKADMESSHTMDRLICGDVGFGKTEVAIRAAFKSVMSGRQVAILVPTTVLAQQHFQTFRERMSEYPVNIELLSRFRTKAEQGKVVRELAAGSVDIVIGTHRLISSDISFKNLGLVVIDEEQRFGVKHKERFKVLFRLVDVLTLSATPIPRTLYLALMGARDMSSIETPPPNRFPVHTSICPYDERVIRAAIERELARGGQIFFLHNRVQSIERVREKIEDLCPGARVAIGHGQMHENDLEVVMTRFIAGEIDVLVCTTIIESGIDIPNANTIIIDRADRFGLADLYQLRGRVGRAHHKAYAILMLPRDVITAGDARKRINAIKQYSSLGAGFKVAMRDLEIRGAGNLLGTRQSGHIMAVGFDLYCKLLKLSVARLRGEPIPEHTEVAIKIDFVATSEAEFLASRDGQDQPGDPENRAIPAFIPASFLEDTALRIQAYRQIAELSRARELRLLERTWGDRFGPFPQAVVNLLAVAELRLAAGNSQISVCEISGNKLMLTRNGKMILVEGKFPRLTGETPTLKLREAISLVNRF